ncbi:probable prolyl 4-hydroxylase 7 [Ananas comosus]|uniref:procollagen-proline 4-dioxygenase n=1 Tax=Ananas comosus TaxID=4615 RepID=A0A6P5F5C3_ANACO|nr:probable prolyl 4-hydroxylase 7 [Ananas comosus]
MYLANVAQGGETVFTKAAANRQRKGDSLAFCASTGFSVKPKKGDAVLFFSLHPNGTLDGSSMHGSCPVIAGEKWTATKWIHLTPFSFLSSSRRSKECEDENESCARWAAKGECEKNPEYMVGTEESQGYCRKSCKVCS